LIDSILTAVRKIRSMQSSGHQHIFQFFRHFEQLFDYNLHYDITRVLFFAVFYYVFSNFYNIFYELHLAMLWLFISLTVD